MPCSLVVIHVNKTENVRINVTLRRFRVTTVAVKKAISIKYYECVSVFLPFFNPACNAHAPYYIVTFGLSVCFIFFHVIS
jgi:hypothetical protein